MGHVFVAPGEAPVQVELETWRWEAHYADGKVFKQFGDDGIFHRIGEVDYTNLVEFWMVSDERTIKQSYIPGTQLIHFYRKTQLNIGTPEQKSIKLYCFGYRTDTERIVQAIYPDGHVESVG